jgi:hypothetical protein
LSPFANCFIGYARLEDLVAAHPDRSEPFYLLLVTRRLPGDPVGWVDLVALVQDFAPSGRVRYCRLPAGGYETMGGQPFDVEKARSCHERADRLHREVTDRLSNLGFRIERATVAMPRDLVPLDGTADFLQSPPSNGSRKEDGSGPNGLRLV